jgi:hypothetical protein
MSRLGRGRSCAAGSPERCWLACWALTVGLYGVITGDAAYGLALGPGFGLALGLVSGLRQERAAPTRASAARFGMRSGPGSWPDLSAARRSGSCSRWSVERPPDLSPGWASGWSSPQSWACCLVERRSCSTTSCGRSWCGREWPPWRYDAFLEAMVQRLLLRRSGNAYLFVHRLLRDYLAEPDPDRVQTAA